MTKEALKLAIQLRDTASGYWTENEIPIIEKLIELLADPMREVQRLGQEIEQEPVAWQDTRKTWVDVPLKNVLKEKRTWVELTDEDYFAVLEKLQNLYHRPPIAIFAKAIEQTLKEKNT
jgi:hypothetical protein